MGFCAILWPIIAYFYYNPLFLFIARLILYYNIKTQIHNIMGETKIKKEFSKGCSGRKQGLEKKGGGKFKKQQSSTEDDFFNGL